MNKEYAIILGANALNIGIVGIFKSMGYTIIAIDFRENIDLPCDEHILFDAKDPRIASVLRQKEYENIKVVYTSMDNAGLAQRAICKEFGLLYADEEAILNSHHKDRMQKKWAEAGILNRESFALENFDAEKIQALNNKFKIIIKPSNACASRGITILEINSSLEKLQKAFEYAKENSSSGLVNIEEFILGTEYTIEMLGDNYGNVAVFGISKKYHTENTDNNKICNKSHYNPKDVDDETQNKLAEAGVKCYKALGLKNTLGHLEMIINENGELSPVEMGSRSSGFIASHLVDATSGKCYLKTFMSVLNGGKVKNGLMPQENISSMYYFYDITANSTSKSEVNLMNFIHPQIKSLHADRKNLIKGNFFKKLIQDTDRYGYEILVGDKNILTIEEVKRAEKEFLKELLV